MLLALLACRSFDDLPVLEGPHCAPDVQALVLRVLDGDTLEVLLAVDPDSSGEGTAFIAGDTPSESDTGDTDTRDTDTGDTDTGDTDSGSSDDVRTVRLLGVDAPEIAHTDSEVADCFGDESHEFMKRLTGETVVLSYDNECTDMYGRDLAYVLGTNDDNTWDYNCIEGQPCDVPYDLDATPTPTVLFNDVVIRYGYARVYEDFDDIRLADLLYGAEDAAIAANRGLWAECE